MNKKIAKTKPAAKTDHKSREELLKKFPKWLLPAALIVAVAVDYFGAQIAASLIVSLYALARGMNNAQANNWLNNSVAGQFFFVLLFELFIVGIIFLLLRYFKRSLKDIGLKKIRLVDPGLAVVAYPAYLILYIIGLSIVKHFYSGLQLNQNQQIGFNSVHGTLALTLTFFSLVVLPPLAEELLFRGFLFEGLKRSMHWVYAGVFTSVIFAAAHLPEGGSSGLFWVGAIDVFLLSLVLVFLKQKTKSLWPGIFLHATKNLIAFISLFLLTNR